MADSPMGPRPTPGTPPAGAPRPSGPVATAAAVSAAVLDPIRLLRMYWHWLAVAVVLGGIVGLGVHLVLARTAPQFRSSVVFRVQQEYNPDRPAVQGETGNRDGIELFMGTEGLEMTGDIMLGQVIADPQFQQLGWAQQFMTGGAIDTPAALESLRKAVNARPIPLTNFFRLTVTASTADDAAEIARILSDTYIASRGIRQRTDVTDEQRRLTQQRGRLSDQLLLTNRRIETLLTDGNLTSLRETDSETAIEIRQLQGQLGVMRQQLALSKQNLANQLREFKDSLGKVYPQAVIAEAENDRIAMQLKAEIVSLEADLSSLRERLGPNHQTVVLIESRIRSREERRRQIVEERQSELFTNLIEGSENSILSLESAEKDIVERLDVASTRQQDITQIIKQVEETTRERNSLLARIDELDMNNDRMQLIRDRGIRVSIAEPATRSGRRAFPQIQIFLPAGVLLFIGLASGLIVLKELREQRIRGPQDVGLIPRTRLLGVLPDLAMDPLGPASFDKACLQQPDGAIAETMRQIRTTVLKRLENSGHKSLLLVSAAPGSGGSSVAANLAVSLARVDKRVLLIDANMRKPSLHKTFDLPAGPGMAELLRDSSQPMPSLVRPTTQDNLAVLTAGSDRSGVFDRLNTADMARIIQQAEAGYDLVILDAPPAVVSTDAIAIAQHVGATVLIVRAFAETRGLLARLRNQFADVPAEFLGVILNAVQTSAGGYLKRNMQQSFEYSKSVVGSDKKRDKAA